MMHLSRQRTVGDHVSLYGKCVSSWAAGKIGYDEDILAWKERKERENEKGGEGLLHIEQ